MNIAKINAHLMSSAVRDLFQKVINQTRPPFEFLFLGTSFVFELSNPTNDRFKPTPMNDEELQRAEQFITLFEQGAKEFSLPISEFFSHYAMRAIRNMRDQVHLDRVWGLWGAGGLHLLEFKIGMFKEEEDPGTRSFSQWPPREEPLKYFGAEINEYYVNGVYDYQRTGVLPISTTWQPVSRVRVPVEIGDDSRLSKRMWMESLTSGFGPLQRYYV